MLTGFFDLEHFIHSIKTVIACLVGLFLANYLGLTGDQWVMITIIVVMCAQIYVGSVIQKAYLRFLGTLVGCLFASFTLIALGSTPLATAIAVSLSSFIFSYLATKYENYMYAATLGAVTTAIIMLTPHPTLLTGLERFLEISLGLLIATLVSQFVLPIHARTHLHYTQAATLKQLRAYYQETMLAKGFAASQKDYQELDESMVKSLLKQRQLAKESIREKFALAFDKEHFMKSLYYEREILRAMTFMHHAIMHVKKAATLLIDSPSAKKFNADTLAALDFLIKAIERGEGELPPFNPPSTQGFKNEIKQQEADISTEERIYIDGFIFSAEILINGLVQLAALYRSPIANFEKIDQNLTW